jgi:Domain of unknown function (DUF4390)
MLHAASLLLDGAAPNASPIGRFLCAALVAAGLFIGAAPAAAAERIEVLSAELQPAADGDGIELDAVFDLELPWTLEDALNGGVPLYFVVEFELYRTRWYWFDERRVAASLTYRLSYSPLTRQYRLARGTLALPFETLGSALASLRRIGRWTVIERGALTGGANYRAQVRMRLDTSQLPRPFQIGAITSRDWTLGSEWRNVPVRPELLR